MLTDQDIMAQVQAVFCEEQAEHRRAAVELLLELERVPDHPQRQQMLDHLFREAHSLKGSARAAQQMAIEQLAHRVEDVLSAVRAGRVALSADLCDPIYAAMDAIGVLVERELGQDAANLAPYQALLDHLMQIVEGPPPQLTAMYPSNHAAHVSMIPTEEPVAEVPVPASNVLAELNGARPHMSPAPETVRLSTTLLDRLLSETGELLTCSGRAYQRERDTQALANVPAPWRRTWRQVSPVLAKLQTAMPVLDPTVHHMARQSPSARGTTSLHSSVMPDGVLSERAVLTLVKALTQANTIISDMEQRFVQLVRHTAEDSSRLAAVTDRLHDQVRRTRMLPVATLFSPLRLQLRELARVAGKQAELDLDDGEAEADRQVLDQLREVLLHLLRNALDHGIEPPETRSAAGKPAIGRIALQACVSGDHLVLMMTDDGAGIDLERVRQRAVASGLIDEASAERSTEAELYDFVFLPGFSTKGAVSALSGRGVGLDVVRTQIERMHGRVTLQSISGSGCVFTITVPLSLTSTQGLLLEVGQSRYVLPIDAVQRILTVAPRDVQMVEGRAVMMLDHRPVLLVPLADLLAPGHQPMPAPLLPRGAATTSQQLALLIGNGDRQIACMVGAVLGEQSLIVQRLPFPLQHVRFIAGATIMADGNVVPILDSVDILRAALGSRSVGITQVAAEAPARHATILVADDSITTRTLERNILESVGYLVRLATNGEEAYTILQEMLDDGGCDLLLSDVDMPHLNGFDLVRRVREDARCLHLPVVLVTSLDTAEDRERGIAAGADAYIVKRTFDQQTLLDTIARLV